MTNNDDVYFTLNEAAQAIGEFRVNLRKLIQAHGIPTLRGVRSTLVSGKALCEMVGCADVETLLAHFEANSPKKKEATNSKGGGGPKLTQKQRDEIRRRYTGARGEIAEFSREYGVSDSTMWEVVHPEKVKEKKRKQKL